MRRFSKAERSELDELRTLVARGGGNKASQLFASNSSGQIVPSGTPTTIVGWTEVLDSAAAFNPATGIFTVPVTGAYFVSAALLYNTGAAPAGTGYYVFVSRSGVLQLGGANIIPTGGTGTANFGAQGSGIVFATQGQTISVTTFHSAGLPQALNASGTLNTFSIAQVA